MGIHSRLAAALLVGGTCVAAAQTTSSVDPFSFFQPSVSIAEDDRRALDRGEPLAHVVPSENQEVAVFAAVAVHAEPDRVIDWMRRIEALKKSEYVLQIGRFSSPARLSDLDALSVDYDDLADLRRCRPGRCGMKLGEQEMTALHRAATTGGADEMQKAFRRMVLSRVEAYAAGGAAALPPYEDREGAPLLPAVFASIVQHTPFLTAKLPQVSSCLDRLSCAGPGIVDSFLYWSKEHFAGKPVISVTHEIIARGGAGAPEVIVTGRQIFATHYTNGSLGVTALVRRADGRRYLAYLNRTSVDILGGMLGGLARIILQRRLAADAPALLVGLRNRLDSGEPPPPAGRPDTERYAARTPWPTTRK